VHKLSKALGYTPEYIEAYSYFKVGDLIALARNEVEDKGK